MINWVNMFRFFVANPEEWAQMEWVCQWRTRVSLSWEGDSPRGLGTSPTVVVASLLTPLEGWSLQRRPSFTLSLTRTIVRFLSVRACWTVNGSDMFRWEWPSKWMAESSRMTQASVYRRSTERRSSTEEKYLRCARLLRSRLNCRGCSPRLMVGGSQMDVWWTLAERIFQKCILYMFFQASFSSSWQVGRREDGILAYQTIYA